MKVSGPRISVVIVTYNSKSTIDKTLSELQQSVKFGLVKVIVVDNASCDGTADFVNQRFPWAILVRNTVNIGFGRGCNAGFQEADTTYILALNPDAVMGWESLSILIEFFDANPRAGICAPAVREKSGALQQAGNLPAPWKIMFHPLLPKWTSRNRRRIIPGEPPLQTDWVCGAVMLLRKTMLKSVGEFDPRFFLYFEETDLCLRAQKAGWQIWTVGEAVAEHVSGASAKTTNAKIQGGNIVNHYYTSRFYFLTKHFGWLTAVIVELGELIFLSARALIDLPKKKRLSIIDRLHAPILKLPTQPQDLYDD